MSYSRILGNAFALDRLKGIVSRRRVAHAYLFAGPAGVGKRLAALGFAKALVCPNARNGIACDGCLGCRQADAHKHASVRPLAHLPDKREILIEQIRELQRGLSFRAADDRRRMVLIDEAERLNEEAQNALLKTLEEPPERCTIVLVSASPASLLPTILSRCQTILFSILPDELVERFCREQLRLPDTVAPLVARLAGGSPGRAAALAAGAEEFRARSAELLAAVAAGDLNPVIERLSRIRDNEEARERARESLTVLALALREVLRARAGGRAPDPAIVPADLVKRLEAADIEGLAARIEAVLDRLRMIDQNANVPLALEDALLRI